MEVGKHLHYSKIRRLSSESYYLQEGKQRQTRKRNSRKTQERNRRILNERKRRVLKRIENRQGPERDEPMMTASNIHYELADRVQGLSAGGIGAMLLLARKTGLIKDIDSNLVLLKRHLPYHESDHVLNIAFNNLAGGKRIEHIELRRNDEVYLNALGAERIPDPTTAGDFCRRFRASDIMDLMDAFNQTRKRVWAQQPPDFFDLAILDADGTLIETDAECKTGVDIAYDGTWGYHPLLVSLANTAEPLFLVNRSGNRPSQEQACLPGQGRRPLPPGRIPENAAAWRYQVHADQAPGPVEQHRLHPLHLRLRETRLSQGPGRRPPSRGL